jgi:hypothetical protein
MSWCAKPGCALLSSIWLILCPHRISCRCVPASCLNPSIVAIVGFAASLSLRVSTLAAKEEVPRPNLRYRFRCIFHGSETRNDRNLEVIVQRDSEGTITSRRQGCHKRTTTAVYVVSALFLPEYRQTRLRGQAVYPYYAKQRSSRPPARR